jgi:hypothetical protein
MLYLLVGVAIVIAPGTKKPSRASNSNGTKYVITVEFLSLELVSFY